MTDWPDRGGTAERIVDEELQRSQYLGDATALDRLVTLSSNCCDRHPNSAESQLIAAQVASTRHCFADAKLHLRSAEALGAPVERCNRLWLAIKQAMGEDLPATLAARQEIAEISGEIGDLVALGALYADFGEYEHAERTYLRAISLYRDVSPFPLAWACFQLGVLWGETVPERDYECAKYWYRQAVEYLPVYSHARVHLAEIHLETGQLDAAEVLLRPVIGNGDPEVEWRYSDLMAERARGQEAAEYRGVAAKCFEALLARHKLAFADHAAEFFLSSGADSARAAALAGVNLANRPTLRAFELAYAAALALDDSSSAAELQSQARAKFARSKVFGFSTMSGLR
ncbi:hypothetical protein [Aestuariivirga sp.]|uniref:tetratricopeptide repeat protein n=1 Tax=Aestuariivirga sp. TaxID=2650926 RepID=UPI0030192230